MAGTLTSTDGGLMVITFIDYLSCGGRSWLLLLPAAAERVKKICQKEKKRFSSVRTAGMNPRNGWDNVRAAGSGILLWKKLYQREIKEILSRVLGPV